MDAKTEEALRKSIIHWEENAAAKSFQGTSVSPNACALCGLFMEPEPYCTGCPIYAHTGKPFCRWTPYKKAAEAWDNRLWEPFLTAAHDEIAFLKSLLPESSDA